VPSFRENTCDKDLFSVSFVIPVYNRKFLLLRSIESLISFSQCFAIEIVIVNDASTDGLCEAYLKENLTPELLPFVRYITLPINMGVTFAKNLGAFNANYYWLVFLDSDDTLLGSFCAQFLHLLKKGLDVDGFFFRCISLKSENLIGSIIPSHFLCFDELIGYSTHGECLPVISRQTFVLYPYDHSLRGCEGWAYLTMLASGKKLWLSDLVARKYDDVSNERLSNLSNRARRAHLISFYYLRSFFLSWKTLNYPSFVLVLKSIFNLFLYFSFCLYDLSFRLIYVFARSLSSLRS